MKIGIKELPILVKIEQLYKDCYEETFGTFDYELFGERVYNLMQEIGLKVFLKEK